MNVYLHEMKAYRWHTLIWSVSLSGLILLLMCFYPIFQKDLEVYNNFINNFPEAAKAAMGIVVENFSTPLGYYAFCYTYCALLAAIQAMNLGVGILSKEERERTADFLMTKPFSRFGIVTAKLFAVLTILLITNIIYNIASVSILVGFAKEEMDMTKLVLMNLSMFLIQLIFFSIGLAVTGFMKKVKAVLPISLGMVFTFFAISAFAVTSKEDHLRYLTPFQYFTTTQILKEAKYELSFVLLSIAIVIVSIALSYYRYIRKNIPAL